MKSLIREDIINDIENFRLPSYAEIPDVGLYLDQTCKYINSYIEVLKITKLTTSMLSNYVKQKIISNPVKKQYYRHQIAGLIYISITKSVLSLNQISKMLSFFRSQNIENEYETIKEMFESTLKKVFNQENSLIYSDEDTQMHLLRYVVITISHKIYLDCCFDELENSGPENL